MKKCFNNVQMLKSSEDCDKYSTRFLHKNLVGGTATTGRDNRQIRRLIKGSAAKPLDAVGTLTSLLCNSAKVVEKLLHRHSEPKAKNPKKTGTVMPDLIGHLSRIKKEAAEVAFGAASQAPCLGSRLLSCPRMTMLWLLRFAKAPFRITLFALLFTFATTAESLAAKTCDCGTKGHETECCWEITEVTKDGKTEKVLTISPGVDENGNTYTNVQMKNYQHSTESISRDTIHYSNAPWATKTVTSVKVEGGINNIGQYAFSGENIQTFYAPEIKEIGNGAFYVAPSLTDAYIPKVNKIEDNAFQYNYSLKSIELPNVKYIGSNAFESCKTLESVYMPSVETANWSAFWDTNLNSIDMPNVSKIGGNIIGQKLKYIGFSTQKDAEGCLIDDRGERVTKGDSNCVTEISIDDDAFINNSFLSNCSADGSGCGSCGYDYVMHGLGCVADCGAGYLGKEGRCIDSALGCGENYRDMGGWCNRIRYTPAEAAEVLRDDNTNEVTITFRK